MMLKKTYSGTEKKTYSGTEKHMSTNVGRYVSSIKILPESTVVAHLSVTTMNQSTDFVQYDSLKKIAALTLIVALSASLKCAVKVHG